MANRQLPVQIQSTYHKPPRTTKSPEKKIIRRVGREVAEIYDLLTQFDTESLANGSAGSAR